MFKVQIQRFQSNLSQQDLNDDLETDKKSAKNYTSGKSVIPLATCPDVKETYENLRILLELIELKKLEPYQITGDLKVLNILGN